MGNLGEHWQVVKWILRYLKGTQEIGLVYCKGDESDQHVQGFVDSDYAGDLDKGRSLTGYVFTLFGNTVCWKAILQHIVALSTTEMEFVALTEAIKEALCVRGLVSELGLNQNSVYVHYDSQSAIHLSKNQMYHEVKTHRRQTALRQRHYRKG